jgi:hypothetical protein
MKKVFLTLIGASLLGSAQVVVAEDINEIFKKINDYAQAKNYPKALEELSWAHKELTKLHQARLGELLPADVNGYKGAEPEIQSAMGFTSIERQYSQGEKEIKVSISGSSGGEGGMGNLAGLAKMGMMFGGAQPGVDQFRLDGRTATLKTEDSPELTVFLESGSLLQITGSEGVDAAALKKFAEALKIGELDSYLKGS